MSAPAAATRSVAPGRSDTVEGLGTPNPLGWSEVMFAVALSFDMRDLIGFTSLSRFSARAFEMV